MPDQRHNRQYNIQSALHKEHIFPGIQHASSSINAGSVTDT